MGCGATKQASAASSEDAAIATGKAAYKAARAKGMSHEEATEAATKAAGRPPPSHPALPQPSPSQSAHQPAQAHQAPKAPQPAPSKPASVAPSASERAVAPPPAEDAVALVRGFLDALRSEYVRGVREAAGSFFAAKKVSGKIQQKLDPFEDKVRSAPNKERAIQELEAQAESIAASIAPIVARGPIEVQAAQLTVENENASAQVLQSSIAEALSLPASTRGMPEAVALAGLAAENMEVLRKAIRLAYLIKLSKRDAITEAEARLREGLQLPSDWDLNTFCAGRLLEGGLGGRKESGVVAYEKQSSDVVDVLQHLFDKTYRKVYTRDRRGAPIPDAFKIKGVYRVYNDQVWREYVAHRESVRTDLLGNDAPPIPDGVLTSNALKNAKQCLPKLDSSINECWLYHGTTAAAASGIAENDFRLDLTGSNAGTLYGKGIYLAENVTKSDEYGEGPRGPAGEHMEQGYEGPRPPPGPPPTLVRDSYILICRSTLGKVHYNDEQRPDPDKLQNSCLQSKEYHSVLGDRLKLNGTFREIIVYTDDLAYPEYIIHYERIFFHERFADIYRAMMARKKQGKFKGPTDNEKDVLQSMWNVYAMPHKGKINKWQLLDLLTAIDQPPENEQEDLDATFNEWDTKKDGKIDWDEFLQEMVTRVNDGMVYYE
eukprot:TRINITY_DN58662_c0_g1_i2.p1 TRINITY_DN58662_c0_g1~~TRINITY_DN58662_c0_g1_i2.p1  ORF type:complete len:659 (-),score=111.42 TRINITY_DN58662_c0_g1_i2:229-2205(-)